MIRFLTLILLLFPFTAQAQLELDLKRGKVQAVPVAITDFHSDAGSLAQLGSNMSDVVRANLESSGLFTILDRSLYLQDPAAIAGDNPKYGEWTAIGASYLVSGKITRNTDGNLRVEFRLWDTLNRKQAIGTAYTTTDSNWRRIAHIISDAIFTRVTGEGAYFDSRIVYVSEQGLPNKRVKRLAIMDQDGANHKYLTDGSNLVLTPRFSPSQQQITYLAYVNRKPRVYLYDISTGRQEVLGDFPGMTFSPRFSPDGNKVIMSLSLNGNSDIYTMDLRNRKVTQLTRHPSIDTSPSFAPDGQRVVFESDRGGSQQLYVMSINGNEPTRITFGEGRYANPVWSPRGDYIAFTRMYKGKFYIGLIKPDGSGERMISTAFHVEGPSWAPNGRYLTYFKEVPVGKGGKGRQAKLYQIDVTGFNEREIETPLNASDPAWSPLNN